MMIARQMGFKVEKPVCAWCNPPGPDEPWPGNRYITHTICPKHFKELMEQLQNANLATRDPVPDASRLP